MRSTIRHALLLGLGLVLGYATVSMAVVLCTPLGSLTTNLNLCKPAAGETNWTNAINNNWEILDSVLSGLSGSTPANGELLIGNGSSFTVALPTGSGGIVITTGSGTLDIGCSGCGGGGSGTITASSVAYGSATGVITGFATHLYYDTQEFKMFSSGTERVRFNQSGSAIFGTIGAGTGSTSGMSPAQEDVLFFATPPFLIYAQSGAQASFVSEGDSGGTLMSFITHRGTLAAPTATQSGDQALYLAGIGWNVDGLSAEMANMKIIVDGTPGGTGDLTMPGRFEFYTSKQGTASSAEVFRLDSNQKVSAASSVQVGTTGSLEVGNAQIGMAKTSGTNQAPGAGGAKIAIVCGTNAGTAKIVAYAGTSSTPVTVLDNIGAGVTGC